MSTSIAPTSPTPDTGKCLNLTEKFGYAAGDFASCLYFGIFSNYLTIYYTDVMVIGAAAAGTMLLFTRTWDWINDPIMGVIADRTNSKMGKFRPWILWMIIPYVLIGILTFTAFDLSPSGRLVYAYVTYTALTMVYTMINIPYSALMGVMTPNSEERTELSSFRFVGAFTGTTVVAVSLPHLVELFGGGDDKVGYTSTVFLYAIMAAAAFLFTFMATKERIRPAPQQQLSVAADLKALSKNRPWVTLLLISVLTIVSISVGSSVTIHFFKYVGGGEKLGGYYLGVSNGVQIFGVLMTKYVVRWFGSKKRAFAMLNFAGAAWMLLFYFIDPTNFPLLVGHLIVASLLRAPLMPMFWSMIADTADYGAWKLKQRSTGLLFSAGNFSQKIGWSLGPAIGLWLLSSFGYRANQAQSAETIHGLLLMMSIIPAGFGLLAGLSVLLYGIDGRTEREMTAAMSK